MKNDALSDPNVKIKLAVAVVVLVGAAVLLANNFGLISLFGSDLPKGEPLTAPQVEVAKAAQTQAKKDRERIEALPPAQRPIQVGGN